MEGQPGTRANYKGITAVLPPTPGMAENRPQSTYFVWKQSGPRLEYTDSVLCAQSCLTLQSRGILKNGMGCHFLFQEDCPNLEIKPVSPASPAFIGNFFITAPPGKPNTDSSVQFSCSVVFDSLRPHESQHARPPCPSPTPGVYSNSCPSSW